MMRAMMSATAGIRRPGAAALDLAYVAAGYYDGFWEVGLNPWDVAAGALLAALRDDWQTRVSQARSSSPSPGPSSGAS